MEKHSRSRTEYLVKARSQFKERSSANNVEILLPLPPDAIAPTVRASQVRTRLCKWQVTAVFCDRGMCRAWQSCCWKSWKKISTCFSVAHEYLLRGKLLGPSRQNPASDA